MQQLLQMLQATGSIIAVMRKTSALFPLLAVLVLLTALMLVAIFFAPAGVVYMLGGFWGLSLSVLLVAYLFFAKTNPDMLRSESFSVQNKVLDMLGDEHHRVNTTAGDLIAVLNPNNPMQPSDRVELPSGGEETDDEVPPQVTS